MEAIYARQSLEKLGSLSIEGQIEICRRYAAPDARVFQDAGFSGKNTNRPAFSAMMDAVKAGEISKIVVYRLDRFSRSIADFSRIWELLEQNNVQFCSATENFDTSTPMGRAMLHIVLVFAQLERETTAERVKDNYIHRFSLGAWPGGPAPYGYDLTKIQDGGRTVSSLTPNEKAAVVLRIFRNYAESDISLRQLAKNLTAEGIPGPKREVWDNVTLSRMLHSPVYVQSTSDIYFHHLAKGLQIQQDVEAFDGVHGCNVIGRRDRSRNKYNSLDGQMLTLANHEGLIEAELWLAVQDKLSRVTQIPRSGLGKYTWLTGLLKCGKCGYSLKINNFQKENRLRLVCSGRSNFGSCDASIAVDIRELEVQVAAQIQTLLDASPPGNLAVGSADHAKELLALDQKIDRLISALAESSSVSAAYISREIDRLDQARQQLLAQTPKPQAPVAGIDFARLPFEEKKRLAADLIQRLEIIGDAVNIMWNV